MLRYIEKIFCFLYKPLVTNRKSIALEKILLWIMVLSFIGLPTQLYSQQEDLRFKRLSTEQGLHQASINCIFQDEKGFLWFGTQEGLNRYDGYDFICYKHDPDDPTSISDSYIWCIIEDKSGIFWIGTNDGGLNSFDPGTEKFNSYKNKKDVPSSLSHNYVRAVLEDHEGVLWVGTFGKGLNKFDRKNESFTRYQYNSKDPKSLSNNIVTSIYEDSSGNLWIGTREGGLNKFDRKTGEFIRYQHIEGNPLSLSHNNVTCILEDSSGILWIGTQGGGLNIFDRSKEKFKHFKTEKDLSNNISCIWEDRDGIIWIGTQDRGVNTFDKKTGGLTGNSHNPGIPHSLSNNVVMSIYEDTSGIIWVGTYSGGLNKYNPRSKQFSLFQQYPGIPGSLSSNDIRAIYEDRTGTLWIGTNGGGLNRRDKKTGKFTHYNTENNNLSHNDVRCILGDQDGDLWIGTGGGGLNKFDRKNEKFKPFKYEPGNENSLSNNLIRTIYYKDHDDTLWIGTEGGGLNKFDKKNGSFKHYTTSNSQLNNDIVFAIYEDRSGILWIGTRVGGLNKFNQNTEEFTHNTTENSNLSHDFILCIYEDQKGNLWIGTYGGGLNKMTDRENGIFKSYRVKDGLPNDVINGITEDNQGNLWLSTNNGITKFNPKIEDFNNYDVDDGLQSNEFYAGAFFENSEGKIFFGGINGLTSFYPGEIEYNTSPPPVVITDFLIFNKPVEPKWKAPGSPLEKVIHEIPEITLSHQQHSFSFEFTALDYTSPQKNQYKYMLEGWNKNWVETDSKNRRATYTNLDPGNYVFKVKGSNSDGEWNEKGSSIKIRILLPWWRTWWAYALYIFAFIILAYLIWSAFTKNVLRQKVEAKTRELKNTQAQLVQSEKMRAVGDLVAHLAHELNNPTSFIQTTSYNLQRDLDKLKTFLFELAGEDADKEILAAFSERFETLFKHMNTLEDGTNRIKNTVKDMRTFSRMDKNQMSSVNLQEGLQATLNLVKTKYKEEVDFITDFQPSLRVKGNLAELNQVFMNIIKNACQAIIEKQKSIKDKSKGTLTIKIFTQKNEAVISFQDTGKGIPKDLQEKIFEPFFTTRTVGEGMGLGLSVSFGIIKKHQGRIEVTSEKDKGTTINLYLPLEREE